MSGPVPPELLFPESLSPELPSQKALSQDPATKSGPNAGCRSSPIRVNWVETALWPGRLGLTFAPGKKGASVLQPGLVHDRDMAEDFGTLAQAGVQVIAPLIEEPEYSLLGMVGYPEEAEKRSITVIPFPIQDRHAPGDPHAFAGLTDELTDALLDGKNVVVHCRGGLGRAGLTAACLLVQGGMSPEQAIALVRRTRPGAIETGEQEAFVYQFADLPGPGGTK